LRGWRKGEEDATEALKVIDELIYQIKNGSEYSKKTREEET